MSTTALSWLFAVKGPEEPIKPHGVSQASAPYIAGREDFLFGEPYRPQRFADALEQYVYACAWAHERLEAQLP